MKKKEKKEQTDDSDQNPYKNHFFHLFSFSPKRVGAIKFAVPGGKRITSQGETSLCGAKHHVARTGNTSLFPRGERFTFHSSVSSSNASRKVVMW